jgi:hypothetical protein
LLPKREAVWWACLCAREGCGADLAPAAGAAVLASERWVAEPIEENRRAAMAAAEAATFGTPAGCAALAAFLSGGSLGPPNVEPIPPGEDLTARAVAGAILLAAVVREPEKAPQKFQSFLARGLEVLHGSNRWEDAAPRAQEGRARPDFG